jgi:hypothetical protein
MAKITFDTKVDARVLGGNRVNKVVADDMNQIKAGVNALYDAGADWKQYSTAGRNLITGQPVGYRIFNTTENRPEFWNGSEWLPIAAGVKDIHCGGSPNYPSALEGDVLQVTGAGKIGGTSGKNVFVKDLIVCLEANAGGTDASVGSKWRIVRDIPQLSTAQRDSLSNPNTGLMIYNTDMNMFNYFNGTIWIVLASIFFGTTDEIDAATLPAGTFYYDTYIEEAGWSDGVTSNPFSGSSDCACVKTVKVSLSSAQILDSNTSPVQLIAAPGAGKMIRVTSITAIFTFNGVAYATNTNGQVRINTYQLNSISLNFGASTESTFGFPQAASGTLSNQSINFTTQTGNPTAGDGTIDLYITYQILSL